MLHKVPMQRDYLKQQSVISRGGKTANGAPLVLAQPAMRRAAHT